MIKRVELRILYWHNFSLNKLNLKKPFNILYDNIFFDSSNSRLYFDFSSQQLKI